jgi:hypothetical protein
LVVAVAVAGEIICAWEKPHNRREALERFFGILLIAGLLMEIFEAVKEDKEVARLQLRTANVETTNALLWQTNLVLRSNVAVLEIKAQDRTIKPEQRKKFIQFLKNTQKGPVMIGTRQASDETKRYCAQIASLLVSSGFTIQSDVNYRDNILLFDEGSSLGFVVDDKTNAPLYTGQLEMAFERAEINCSICAHAPKNQFGQDPPPGSNEVLILVLEKP